MADFTGSIQTVVQQMTLFRLFSTCRLIVEAGHYFLRKCLRQSSVPEIAAKKNRRRCSKSHSPWHGGLRRSYVLVKWRQYCDVMQSKVFTSTHGGSQGEESPFWFVTLSNFHFDSNGGISEFHFDTDKWLKM